MKILLVIILIPLLIGCNGGNSVTKIIYNEECDGHGGVSINLSKAVKLDNTHDSSKGTLCNDGTYQ